MSEAVNIAEPQVIPLAKSLEVIVGSGGVHRLSVPLSEQPIALNPLVPDRSLVIILP